MKIVSTRSYAKVRQQAYWPTGDQLDAIIKTFKQLDQAGIDIGDEGRALVAHSDAVKAKYPKP